MHIQLAPGEVLAPGTRALAEACLAQPGVEAVLLPLRPAGDWALARAARRYLAAWDARFLHPMNFYAPAARAVTRVPMTGPRNADAAPYLADLLATGARIEALADAPVLAPIAADLGTWTSWARAEGEAWGRAGRTDPRLRPFVDGRWARHMVQQLPRRVIESLQATKSAAPLPLVLHLARESAFTAGVRHGLRARTES